MSAFVAFNGFPGQDVQDPIGTLLLQQRQTPVDVPAKPVHVGVLAATSAHIRGCWTSKTIECSMVRLR